MENGKKEFKILLLAIYTGICLSLVGYAKAAEIIATSCQHADVQAAVDKAQSGDIVNVPAGLATWQDPLFITKGLILQGGGVANTVITSNITNSFAGIITIAPAENEAVRVTGFTLDGNQMSNCIYLSDRTIVKINKIRIHSNKLISPGGHNSGRCINIFGTVYGVIDNNIFELNPDRSWNQRAIECSGVNNLAWVNFTQALGSEDNIYYEDNIFYGPGNFHFCGQGGVMFQDITLM